MARQRLAKKIPNGNDGVEQSGKISPKRNRTQIIQYVFENYHMTPAEIDAKFNTGHDDARCIKNAARKRRTRILARNQSLNPPESKKQKNTNASISNIANAVFEDETNDVIELSDSVSSSEEEHQSEIIEDAPPSNEVYDIETILQSLSQANQQAPPITTSTPKPAKAKSIKIFGEAGSTAIVRTGTTEFTIKVPNGVFMEIEY